jgi:superfamily II DNA or RNA helicase
MTAEVVAAPATSRLELRPYQREALRALADSYRRGERRLLVSLPTGTGKTVVFSDLIRQAGARGKRALVLVHRDELVHQTIDKLALVAPELAVGVVKAERDEYGAPIVIASAQTVARPARLERLVPDFALVVADEAHHAVAPSWRRALEHLRCFAPGGPLLVGFSATCERADNKHLGEVFAGVAYHKDLLEMIEAGYLVDVRGLRVELALDLDTITIRDSDFAEGDLSAALADAHAPEHVASAYLAHAADRKALAFFPSVALAREAAAVLVQNGIAAAVITGETPLDERRHTLAALRRGDVQVVSNCGVLTEGFDDPSVDCILMARPTKSGILYRQVVGRALRPFPGKADALVIDFAGATGRHRLQSLPQLFGLKPLDLEGETVLGAVAAQRRAKAAPAMAGVLVSRPVDLLARVALRWTQTEQNVFVLPVPDGALVLDPEGERFRVWLLQRGRPAELWGYDLSAGYAQGVAEDIARRMGWAHLSEPDAAWRARPASEKQVALLADLSGLAVGNLSCGEASDRITTHFALSELSQMDARRWS